MTCPSCHEPAHPADATCPACGAALVRPLDFAALRAAADRLTWGCAGLVLLAVAVVFGGLLWAGP